jgi:transposase
MAFLSNFYEWDQKDHSADWLLFPQNIGPYLSIDETSLSQGELYTILTNKEAKGKKGAIVAILKGVDADKIIPVLAPSKKLKDLK